MGLLSDNFLSGGSSSESRFRPGEVDKKSRTLRLCGLSKAEVCSGHPKLLSRVGLGGVVEGLWTGEGVCAVRQISSAEGYGRSMRVFGEAATLVVGVSFRDPAGEDVLVFVVVPED